MRYGVIKEVVGDLVHLRPFVTFYNRSSVRVSVVACTVRTDDLILKLKINYGCVESKLLANGVIPKKSKRQVGKL